MDRVAVLPNERIGIEDFEAGAGGKLVQEDQIRQGQLFLLKSGRVTGAANTSARILDGFDVTFAGNPDTTATITRGSGIFPFIGDSGGLQFGIMVGNEGPASQIINFSTAAPSSTQAVFVRATQTLADAKNRVFWNPSGSPAREFVDNMSTRLAMSWEVTFQAESLPDPGNGEWVKIGVMTLDGSSAPSSWNDYRHFYFEGDPAFSYGTEWGDGVNDRNADRASYGVKDMHMFVQAMKRQWQDMHGAANGWYAAVQLDQPALVNFKTKSEYEESHFTTVGPAGQGDYTTLQAALTALIAANGGTILLKSGTHPITSTLTLNKPITIIGIEDGVIISNETNNGVNPMLHLNDKITLKNIATADGTSPSNLDFEVDSYSGAVVNIEGCTIVGGLAVSGGTVKVSNSTISGRTTTATLGLALTQDFDSVVFEHCTIYGPDTGTWLAQFTGTGDRARYKFRECWFINNGTNQGAVNIDSSADTTSQIAFEDCFLQLDSLDDASGVDGILIEAGAMIAFSRCHVRGNQTADYNQRAIHVDVATGSSATGHVIFDACKMEFGSHGYLSTSGASAGAIAAAASVPVTFRDCVVQNYKVAANNALFVVDPLDADTVITFERCQVQSLSMTTNGYVWSVTTSAVGVGTLRIKDCYVDGAAITSTPTGTRTFVNFRADDARLVMEGNTLSGGFWNRGIYANASEAQIINNLIDMSYNASAANIDGGIWINGPGSGTEGPGYNCLISGNTVYHHDASPGGGAAIVEIQDFQRAIIVNNTVIQVPGSTSTGLDGIGMSGLGRAVLMGNTSNNDIPTSGISSADLRPAVPAGATLADEIDAANHVA